MHLLYLGWFTTVAVLASIYLVITKDAGAAGYFGILLGYIGGIIGNWLLDYVDAKSYYANGFFDAIWKKFFSIHGPQFFGFVLIGLYAYSLYKTDFNYKEAFSMAFGLLLYPLISLLSK